MMAKVSLESVSLSNLQGVDCGWQINYGFAETPFGEGFIAECPRGICHLAFVENNHRSKALVTLQKSWPGVQWVRNDRAAAQWMGKIFQRPSTKGRGPRIRALVRGSAFQVRVWRALLRVPAGTLTTYGRLAAAIGQPSAARAVGNAVGCNPIAFLIPCHRVVREDGSLGGFRWGQSCKQALISWETFSFPGPSNDPQ